jgi:hypothetical protein
MGGSWKIETKRAEICNDPLFQQRKMQLLTKFIDRKIIEIFVFKIKSLTEKYKQAGLLPVKGSLKQILI